MYIPHNFNSGILNDSKHAYLGVQLKDNKNSFTQKPSGLATSTGKTATILWLLLLFSNKVKPPILTCIYSRKLIFDNGSGFVVAISKLEKRV